MYIYPEIFSQAIEKGGSCNPLILNIEQYVTGSGKPGLRNTKYAVNPNMVLAAAGRIVSAAVNIRSNILTFLLTLLIANGQISELIFRWEII